MGNVGNGADGNSWLSYGVDNLMGLVVGTGLVDWLFNMDFSGDWSNDWFSSENWLLGKDWAGREGLGDDWSWLDGSDGSWLMDMGVFSNWDSLVSDLWLAMEAESCAGARTRVLPASGRPANGSTLAW